MATFLEIFSELKGDMGVSELARELGIPKQTISRITSGKTPDPKASTLAPIAQYFGLTIDQLLGITPIESKSAFQKDVTSQTNVIKCPFVKVDNICAFIENSYEPKEFFTLAQKEVTDFKGCFVTKINSDSMLPLITSSMFLIINPRAKIEHGGLFLILSPSSEFIVKKVTIESNTKYLSALNPIYKSKLLSDEFLIIGKVLDARAFMDN